MCAPFLSGFTVDQLKRIHTNDIHLVVMWEKCVCRSRYFVYKMYILSDQTKFSQLLYIHKILE